MALVIKDRVKELSTTAGTGAVTLLGSPTGYQTFTSAVGNGNTTYYAIVDNTSGDWEVGLGTYTSATTSLSRDTVLSSSNAGSLVTFSSNSKDVFVTYPASKGIYTDSAGNAIALGTPASATLTNATGLPISTGVSGLGTGIATFLATPSSANLATAVTNETGSGSLVFATSPTLVTPVLGTPSSGTLTSCTGYTYANLSGTVPTWNQNTTGSAATLTTPRAIYGNNFDGSAALTQVIASTYGGTGNGFTKFTGATTEKTYTLPDATTTILTTNATVTVGQGGTGTSTAFTTGSVVFAGASGVYSQDNANFFWDDTNNRLGIGTTAPATRITINNNTVLPSAGAPSSGSSIWTVGGDSVASGLSFDSFAIQTNFITRRANGTAASPTALVADNNIFQFAARGYGATGYSTGGRAQFSFLASENWTDTAQGAHITFSTTTNGTATALERVRIDNAGNVGIGTTSPSSFAKLAIVGTTATNLLQMATAGNTSGLYMTPNDGGQFTLNSYGSGLTINSTTSTGVVTVGTNNTERMRIDSSGNVGIGTTTPTSTFQGTASRVGIESPRVAADQTLLSLAHTGTITALDKIRGYYKTNNLSKGSI